MKRLLLSVICAFAVHAIILSTDSSWLKPKAGLYSTSKVLTILLSANKGQKQSAESVSQDMGQLVSHGSSPFNQKPVEQPKPILKEILKQDFSRIIDSASANESPQIEKELVQPVQKQANEKIKPKKSLKALTRQVRDIKPIEMIPLKSMDMRLPESKNDEKDYIPSPSSKKIDSSPLLRDSTVTKEVLDETSGSSQPPTSSVSTQLNDSQAIAFGSENVHNPAPLTNFNTPPKYPNKARRMGYEGIVILKILVGEDGRVCNFEIFQSSGYPILDEAAVSAVKMWLFEPATKNEQKIAMWIKVPIRFKLN